MSASTELLVGDQDGQHVLIRAVARSQPDLFDTSDGNRISCEIHIAAGGFLGNFPADLRSDELQSFFEEVENLGRTLAGTATFFTAEGQLALTLAMDGADPVRVQGHALDVPGCANRLNFAFDLDETYLVTLSRGLENVLAAFPVIEQPAAGPIADGVAD